MRQSFPAQEVNAEILVPYAKKISQNNAKIKIQSMLQQQLLHINSTFKKLCFFSTLVLKKHFISQHVNEFVVF